MSVQFYVVQPGDGFARVARNVGSAHPFTDMEYIARANGMKLTDSLVVGRILFYDTDSLSSKARATVDGDNRVVVDGSTRIT
jgi:hypothetical protein